jgi:cytochrome c5
MKKIAADLIAIPILAALLFVSIPATATADDDAAATYASKCKMCHGATAEKKMDKTKADEELVPIVLKGKKAEKPPNMPAYEEKGMTADQAKALIDYMKALK